MGTLKLTLASAVMLATASNLAYAADFGQSPDPAGQLADPAIELGTGWYLRGDVGFARDKMPKLSSDLNLIPNITTKNGWSVGIGGGYKFNNWFRADLQYDYRNSRKATGTGGLVSCQLGSDLVTDGNGVPIGSTPSYYVPGCDVTQQTKVHRWDVMANGYFDIGRWSGITPYVGAGIGVANLRTSGTVNYTIPGGAPYNQVITDAFTGVALNGGSPINYDRAINSRQYKLAWALMAGVGIEVAAHTTLDIGYRYLNLGKSQGIASKTGKIYSTSIIEQEFRAGLRYLID